MEAKLNEIQERLKRACLAAGRDPSEILIIAVSKKQSAATVRSAYALGIRDFGENYAQEFWDKQKELADLTDIRWHFIGHLQTNKVKQVIPFVFALHSLNRISLLDSIIKQMNLTLTPAPFVYLQLTVDSSDQNKTALPPELEKSVCVSLQKAHQQGLIKWAGFMGMGPPDTDAKKTLELFTDWTQHARSLWADFCPEPAIKPQFSLGMSGDLEEAVMAGSTIIRVGSAFFGPRSA